MWRLCFKSKGLLANDGGAQSPGFAVLCTENKTFQIHQQQTSNPIMVIQPTSFALPGKPDHAGRICAISTCGSTLGLSLDSSESEATAHLQDLLELWVGAMAQKKSGRGLSKTDIYENIPLSKIEIDAAWKRSCAFEISGQCYLPPAGILLSSWKAILDASRAEGIDMLDDSKQEILWYTISDEGIPGELFHAILSRVTGTDAGSASWIATCMLEAKGGQLPRDQFLESWRDLLPKKLLSSASWETLKVVLGPCFWHSSCTKLFRIIAICLTPLSCH
jgi:sister chromatid cohesion protein DCC1